MVTSLLRDRSPDAFSREYRPAWACPSFVTPRGRLKLRDFGDGRGELIFYRRPDDDGVRLSHYEIVATDRPEAMRALLAAALGTTTTVTKRRTLFLVGQTRVHLDEVEDLGDFVELEVALRDEESAAHGETVAAALMQRLEIERTDLVACAYADLLAARAAMDLDSSSPLIPRQS